MAEIKQTLRASRMLNKAYECCKDYRHEFIMPEHLLLVLIDEFNFNAALNIFYSPYQLQDRIKEFLEGIESLPEGTEYVPEPSVQMAKVIELAVQAVASSSAEAMDIPHLTKGILALEDSWAAYLLKDSLYGKEANFMSQLINFYDLDDELQGNGEKRHLLFRCAGTAQLFGRKACKRRAFRLPAECVFGQALPLQARNGRGLFL